MLATILLTLTGGCSFVNSNDEIISFKCEITEFQKELQKITTKEEGDGSQYRFYINPKDKTFLSFYGWDSENSSRFIIDGSRYDHSAKLFLSKEFIKTEKVSLTWDTIRKVHFKEEFLINRKNGLIIRTQTNLSPEGQSLVKRAQRGKCTKIKPVGKTLF